MTNKSDYYKVHKQFDQSCIFQIQAKPNPNLLIMSYGQFPHYQTIWLLERAKRFFQNCQNDFETLDNFRPFLVGKWP